MTTRAEMLGRARAALRAAGLAEADLDARLLVADALGTDALGLVTGAREGVPEAAEARLAAHLARRVAREPVARILGEREFWGLPFRLSPETLEPRPDTETVVAAALERVPDRDAPLRLLDLGTGTGCILVALLHELPRALGIGIDRAEGAARTARRNAARNGVGTRAAFLCGDWAKALAARFDLVVSNPPYIRGAEIAGLAPEVARHDPRLALDGGADGLGAYRRIVSALPDLLRPGGAAVLEIGSDQEAELAALAAAGGLVQHATHADLAGRPRTVTLVQRPPLRGGGPCPI